jgi:hypothetical protein
MAERSGKVIADWIKRGREEVHAFITGRPMQEPAEVKPEPMKQEAHGSYEHGLAEAARAPKVKSRGLER